LPEFHLKVRFDLFSESASKRSFSYAFQAQEGNNMAAVSHDPLLQ
jgi:hypothetical protein